jgi:signal transduction histidine kinase
MKSPDGLSEQYRAALRDYATGGGEQALQCAYALGRRALCEGLGVLQMASLHHDAMLALQPDAPGKTLLAIKAAETFFAECLSPFEMAHLGFREANVMLRRLNQALEGEARRIAHMLHDDAGQLLTSVHLALKEISDDLPPRARKRLQAARGFLTQIEEHLRRLSHELRPAILDELGLVPAIKFLAEAVSLRTGMSVTVDASMQGRPPSVIETTLYRSIHEALNNVVKHAGGSQATIRLVQERQEIRCSIRDDGAGFDAEAMLAQPDKRGLGLIGIQERVRALGGIHQINSAPGRGTELSIMIPLGELECPFESFLPTTTQSSARA